MRLTSLRQPLLTYLSMALMAASPLLHASKLSSPAPIEQPPSQAFSSSSDSVWQRLSNGLVYTLSTSQLSSQCAIKLSFHLPPTSEEHALALLTQHALFQGTKELDRPALVELLDQLKLDIDADAHSQIQVAEQSLYFSSSSPHQIATLLFLVQQLAFAPLLTDDAIELARHRLLHASSSVSFEEESPTSPRTLKHQIDSLTPSQVRAFHAKWYIPSLAHLSVMVADVDPEEIAKSLEDLFTFEKPAIDADDPALGLAQLANQSLWTAAQESSHRSNPLIPGLNLTGRVEFLSDERSYVIDGKIWMNSPKWIEKSSNGRLVGALLTALGIGTAILTFPLSSLIPLVFPIGMLTGGIFGATGITYLVGDYFKDPLYVENKRQEDLQKGFEHAYKHHRAGITLTPYERRYLFVQQMAYHPEQLSKPAILLLADLYDLRNPLLAELFLIEERAYLSQIKEAFIQQRNQYKKLMEMLDRELTNRLTPFAQAKEAKLAYAQQIYNQNYWVQQKQELKKVLNQNIGAIERAYQDHQIQLKERDDYIAEQKQAYQEALQTPELSAGLSAAETTLMQMEHEALTTYDQQVETCKQIMQYEQRMATYRSGRQALIYQCDATLRKGLLNFPTSMPSLPDFVDLRLL